MNNNSSGKQYLDGLWYTSTTIDYLLQHYFNQDRFYIVTPINAFQLNGDTLKENLESQLSNEEKLEEFSELGKRPIILPINLDNQHWVCAFIKFKTDETPKITFIDPLGNSIPKEVLLVLNDVYPKSNITSYEFSLQKDSYNCGPWIIESLKALSSESYDIEDTLRNIDIEECRQQHMEILAVNNDQDSLSQNNEEKDAEENISTVGEEEVDDICEQDENSNENEDSDSDEDSTKYWYERGYYNSSKDNEHDEEFYNEDSDAEDSSRDEEDELSGRENDTEDSGDDSDNEREDDEQESEIQNKMSELRLEEKAKESDYQITSKKTGKLRIKLSDRLEWFEDLNEGRGKQKHRMVQTQNRFFDIDRTKNQETKKLAERFGLFRRGLTEDLAKESTTQCRYYGSSKDPFNITGYSGRAYIMADAGALKKQQQLLQQKNIDMKELASYKGIEAKLGYKVKATKNSCHGPYEAVKFGNATICYQIIPLPGHLGNRLIKALGTYGNNKTSQVLHVIYSITGVPQVNDTKKTTELYVDREKKLAKLLLDAASNPFEINRQALTQYGIDIRYVGDTTIKCLNRIMVLVDFHEISRKMHLGKRVNLTDVEEMPFAMTHIEALELIISGKLRMADVFDSNSQYGLPTGESLTTVPGIDSIRNKLYRLDDLYKQSEVKLSTDEAKAVDEIESKSSKKGCLVFFREHFHQKYREKFGGGDDTDNEEYESSDEETASYKS